MRQSTLTTGLKLSARRPDTNGINGLIKSLEAEENLAFFCIFPSGSSLKCISELLMRCAPNAVVTVEPTGVTFVACDQNSGRLVHIDLRADDMLKFRTYPAPSPPSEETHPPTSVVGNTPSSTSSLPLRSVLECSSLHSVFHRLGCVCECICMHARSPTKAER